MLSTCPSCLSQVLHDDSLNQVKCNCGVQFSPFLTVEPYEDVGQGILAMSQKLRDAPVPGIADLPDYSESESVFADIRQFGDGLENLNSKNDTGSSPDLQSNATLSKNTPAPQGTILAQALTSQASPSLPSVPIKFGETNPLMTSGDSVPGYTITGFLAPISTWALANPTEEDPLQGAFQSLWSKTVQGGANAVVGIHWSFTPDGSRILLSGTPVQCQKN